MTDDARQKAREQAKAIEEKLAELKIELIDAAYKLSQTGDDLYLSSLDRKRKLIEALEYALSHKPSAPARLGRVVLG